MTRADGWIAFGETVRDDAGRAARIQAQAVARDSAWRRRRSRFRPDRGRARRQSLDRLGWSPADRVVGFLGRFVPEKGLSHLLEALP